MKFLTGCADLIGVRWAGTSYITTPSAQGCYRSTLAAAQPLRGLRVLDYGCGNEALLGWISRRVGPWAEAHDFDPNPRGLELAVKCCAQAEQFPYPSSLVIIYAMAQRFDDKIGSSPKSVRVAEGPRNCDRCWRYTSKTFDSRRRDG